MPVCRPRNLIFIHVPKNGGQAIETALFGTGFIRRTGKRSWINRLTRGASRLTRSDEAASFLHGTIDYALCAQHLTYAEVRLLGLLPEGFLQQARSFAVVRDPYSRILSSVLHFQTRVFHRLGLSELNSEEDLTRAIDVWLNLEMEDHNFLAHRRPQSDFVTDLDGRIVVQDLLRFERLAEEYDGLCRRLDIASPPLKRIGRRKTDKAGLPPLSQEARALVVEAFRRDFDLLGYSV